MSRYFASMQGRLNTLQKSMVQWDEMHPYSAVHLVQIRGALDVTHLRACINATVAKHGLSRLALDRARSAFHYEGGPADCGLQTVVGPESSWCVLRTEIELQLNRRFDYTRPFSPFRFLATSAGDSFWLGLVYFHPVADAESVAWLLRDIVRSYLEQNRGDSSNPLNLYPDNGVHLLRYHPLVLARKLLDLPAGIRNLRRSHRAGHADADNMANGFQCTSLAPEDLRLGVAAAAAWGVTVNDLFIALLMKALSPLAAARTQERKRRKLSIGCIVNLRRDLGVDSRRTFGLFLGSFTVTHEVPSGISLRKLAGEIRLQTNYIKRHKLYLGTPLELGFARVMFRFCSPGRRRRFYGKHYPLWGGLTNMNLNPLWEPEGPNAPLDYVRGVSTGPVTPLVLSATTLGDKVNLGLSYRTAVFSESDIDSLLRRFREHLEEARQDA